MPLMLLIILFDILFSTLEKQKETEKTGLNLNRNYLTRINKIHIQGNYYNSVLLFNKRKYSTNIKNNNIDKQEINPWFITGLIDAEGSFITSLRKKSDHRTGWEVQTFFKIGLHVKDLQLLNDLRSYWGEIGSINKSGTGLYVFRVSSLKDLVTIIDHFTRYPLVTQKRADFELFKRVVDIRSSGRHTTLVGLQEVLNIRASMNNGLTEELRIAFPNTIPVIRPFVNDQVIPDPYWMAGFVSGEGNFSLSVTKSAASKIGFSAQLRFKITQHTRDEALLQSFIAFFENGSCYKHPDKPICDYRCVNFEYIYNKLIPFFKEYKILGIKALDFNDWCLAAEIVKSKAHLTLEGLDRIRSLKEGMNKGRK